MEASHMITEAHGNLLGADVDALVNTVNTVGVMGKGIALQFKRAYPSMFKDYSRAAKLGEVALGRMHVWHTQAATGPRFVINFPTKGHWKAHSKLSDIERGLDDLVVVIKELGVTSIALPPLGCGNGGLDWAVVEPIIRGRLSALPDLDVLLYVPQAAPPAAEMVSGDPTPPMSAGRAALIELMSRYSVHALGDASLIETQKLMYFLQIAGEPLRLNFVRHHYGPYADNLRHVLKDVEGHYLSGFGDGSSRVQDAEPLTILPGARESAAPVLEEHPETVHRIDRVLELIEGFESAYALELLATVHMLMDEVPALAEDQGRAVAAVQAWSPRKGKMFTEHHIRVAWEALRDRGWAAALV